MADVLVIDDHLLLATAVQLSLAKTGIAATCVEPAPLPELLAAVLDARPTVVLLDLDLGQYGDTTGLIAPLTAAGVRVVVVTGVADRARVGTALEHGAVAYRSKADSLDRLAETVCAALRQPGPHDAQLRMELLEDLRRTRHARVAVLAPFTRLTEREQAALRALCEGCSARELAARWVVSEATIRSHLRGVLTKLGVGSQLAAVAMAIRSGWLEQHSEPVAV